MNPRVAFSTLACPHWDIATVLAEATRHGYDGIEWRGGDRGHVRPTMPAADKALLRKTAGDAGLAAIAVTAYSSLISDDAAVRQAHVSELCRYADLAAELGAPCVRAFIGALPPGTDPTTRYDRVVECLLAAADYAHRLGVSIALEPHDDFVGSSVIAEILRAAPHPALGVIWDIGNATAIGEDPSDSYLLLHERLSYVQVKDGRGRGDQWQLTRLGDGDVPLRRAFDLLAAGGYRGPLSVEWEYAWHPELDPPEIALPQAAAYIRGLWRDANSGSQL
ncbi:MAG TPA: sugar phosphate isomerase/epimerase family protein [Anaerolineales bacterium]|nr:sugar phosphate isomerase/epimerase family protein [Anaerolineales bacterium]